MALLTRRYNIETLGIDSADSVAIANLVRGQFAVLNTLPTAVGYQVAAAVAGTATHYLDLSETSRQPANNKSLVRSVSAHLPQIGCRLNDRNHGRRMSTPRPAIDRVSYRRCLGSFVAMPGAEGVFVRIAFQSLRGGGSFSVRASDLCIIDSSP
ncbi:MAG: hypothetical protein OSB20_03085 [Porticoccaceae bacterium]|nr:hypothetical protein [Porticoccaceae bacterium]